MVQCRLRKRSALGLDYLILHLSFAMHCDDSNVGAGLRSATYKMMNKELFCTLLRVLLIGIIMLHAGNG